MSALQPPTKKPRFVAVSVTVEGSPAGPTIASVSLVRSKRNATTDDLGIDILPTVFGWLELRPLLAVRLVSKSWNEASRLASPSVNVSPNNSDDGRLRETGEVLEAGTRLLPQIHRMFPKAGGLQLRPPALGTSALATVRSFQYLKELVLSEDDASWSLRNEEVPIGPIFQISNLEGITFHNCRNLSWDLSMVRGTPHLKRLIVLGREHKNSYIVGALSSLAELANLRTLKLSTCDNITGSTGDLCPCSNLRHLDPPPRVTGALSGFATLANLCILNSRQCLNITGSIADLRPCSKLRRLDLPENLVLDDSTALATLSRDDFPSLREFRTYALVTITRGLTEISSPFRFQSLTTIHAATRPDFSWNLELLRFVPNLQNLVARHTREGHLEGNLRSLRHLKNSLVHLDLLNNNRIQGSLADLRDFTKLVFVDVTNCPLLEPLPPSFGSGDFSALGKLKGEMPIWRVKDAPQILDFFYTRGLIHSDSVNSLYFMLHENSPDRYTPDLNIQRMKHRGLSAPPFMIELIAAYSCTGWRWRNDASLTCYSLYYFETMWLENANEDGNDALVYMTKKHLGPFRGLNSPPDTKEEYEKLVRGFLDPHDN